MKPTPEQLKGRNGTCETMTVEGPDGPYVINAHEYDPKVHGKQAADDDGTDFSRFSKKELNAWLDEHEVEHDPKASNDDLIALCVEHEQSLK